MPGFTAINARISEAPAPPEAEAAASGQRKATKRRHPARKKPAAQKNGGQESADATAPERISGKGKKRANHPSGEPDPESKRRKSGSLKSSMPTTKTAVSTTTTADSDEILNAKATSSSSTDAGLVSLTSMAKLNGFRYTRAQAAASGVGEPQTIQSSSISYVPETSMSSLRHSLPQTTMQAVRNSLPRGISLFYSSSAAFPSTTQGVRLTRASIGSIPILGLESDRTTTKSIRPAQVSIGPSPTLGFGSDRQITTQSSRGQLFTPVASDAPTESNEHVSQQDCDQEIQSDSGDFGNSFDEEDEEIVELANRIEKSAQTEKSPPSRARKLNIRDTHEHDDYGGALLSEEERKLLDAIKVPQDARKPISRAKFPPPIMDRSSLFGVSSTSALRTCFRVGEALNAGCQAVRNNRNLILELYARITSSWREPKPSRKQHFIINDLYHDKPPFINGTFELWDQSALWEQDSRPFLQATAEGTMCRMIAKMKRDGTKWRLEILSIWKADWDDVEHVAEIYAKPVVDGDL